MQGEPIESGAVRKAVKDMDELLRELDQIRESSIPNESLRSAKLDTITNRICDRLKAWGFSSEAERTFGRNSVTRMIEGVDRRAREREAHLRALREDIASHPDHYEPKLRPSPDAVGTKATSAKPNLVFLGHGRSPLWMKVERHLEKERGLTVQAWESESRTGVHVVEVLDGLMNSCTFGVLVVTAEDGTPSGTVRARQNVIHEIGLFQGKLGFKKVALLEQERVESFSNIDGLQTIRFPGERIEAAFPELERMLRREGLIK